MWRMWKSEQPPDAIVSPTWSLTDVCGSLDILPAAHHKSTTTVLSLRIWGLPPDWKPPLGRPSHTWLRAVEADLNQENIGLASAWRKAAIRDDWRRIDPPFHTSSGVRQGCILAWALFCCAIDWLMRQCRGKFGIPVDRSTFTDIDYNDDAVLFTADPAEWEEVLAMRPPLAPWACTVRTIVEWYPKTWKMLFLDLAPPTLQNSGIFHDSTSPHLHFDGLPPKSLYWT